jgi:hypothetical protein
VVFKLSFLNFINELGLKTPSSGVISKKYLRTHTVFVELVILSSYKYINIMELGFYILEILQSLQPKIKYNNH